MINADTVTRQDQELLMAVFYHFDGVYFHFDDLLTVLDNANINYSGIWTLFPLSINNDNARLRNLLNDLCTQQMIVIRDAISYTIPSSKTEVFRSVYFTFYKTMLGITKQIRQVGQNLTGLTKKRGRF